jgi:hypothetical protein
VAWQMILLLIFGSLLILMFLGIPVALSFMLINVVGMYFLFGGGVGLETLIDSIYTSLNSFVLLPVRRF